MAHLDYAPPRTIIAVADWIAADPVGETAHTLLLRFIGEARHPVRG